MINLIACVTNYKNKLAIGRHNELLFRLKHDMDFFKNITTNSLNTNSKLDRNIVLMGRKTYTSISQTLPGRINIVLTRDPILLNFLGIPKDLVLENDLYFTDISTFNKIYKKYNPNVFVIGGSAIYSMFMNRADKLYITHVQGRDGKDISFAKGQEPDTFMDHFNCNYELVAISEKYNVKNDTGINYRILTYNVAKKLSDEFKYMNFMDKILSLGKIRHDRTNVGTISLYGNQLRFDISKSIPLMTTKRVPFKTIVEELLWFCRGDTDAKILQKRGVKIWDGNTSREFLDKQGLVHYPDGVLGAGYGFQWRFFGANYDYSFADTSKIDIDKIIGGFDQLKYIEDLLENDPFSRRIVLSAWNPSDFDKTALPPCHILLQFYVEEINNQKYLSCQFYMRSNDVFLANVFNVVSYSVLTYILAKRHNMKPKEIIYTCGDSHIYSNHIEQVKQQLSRIPRPFPKLLLDDTIIKKDWSEITLDDFELVGYFPYPAIRAPMAV